MRLGSASEGSLSCYFVSQWVISRFTPSPGLQNPRGLRTFSQHFIGGQKASLRIEILFAYLMAQFTTHCEGLMTSGANANKENFSHSLTISREVAETLIYNGGNERCGALQCLQVLQILPNVNVLILRIFSDPDSLTIGAFQWLQCLHPSHLLYRSGDVCQLSPYFPSQFAR